MLGTSKKPQEPQEPQMPSRCSAVAWSLFLLSTPLPKNLNLLSLLRHCGLRAAISSCSVWDSGACPGNDPEPAPGM